MRKMAKAMLIYTGTNDVERKTNTMKKVKDLIKEKKEIHSENENEIIFSVINQRKENVFQKPQRRNSR